MKEDRKIFHVLWIFSAILWPSMLFGFNPQESRLSPLEGAGSHGLMGIRFGLGLMPLDDGGKKILAPQYTLVKGLGSPLDVGLIVTPSTKSHLHQWGSYIQVTLLEGFALPAFAIRGTLSRSYRDDAAPIEEISWDGIGSWGLLFFTGYLGIGFSHRYGQGLSMEKNSHQFLGFQWAILPPFCHLTFEYQIEDQKSTSMRSKLSFGI